MAEKKLIYGNHAMVEGVISAGCRFFAGYPITPQNEIPELMSIRMNEEDGVFLQTESEIAAINMLFGAAAAGKRAMTSSSSPGISLMQEGISYIAGSDIPVLIVNIVRGGPGLGNIAPAQSDYFQSTRGGGHGDYYTITLAPNSVQELYEFPKTGFELAEKYRNPVLILADGLLGQMMEPVEFNFEPVDPKSLPEPEWALSGCKGRERRVVRSYDLRPGKLEEWNWRRYEKYQKVIAQEQRYEENYCDNADLIMVAYGTCARVSEATVKIAREKGYKIGLFRPITLWPFPQKKMTELAKKTKHFLVIEMSLGQMIEDVKLYTECRSQIHFHGRPGGGVPTPIEILNKIETILGGKK
ncbi:3-methyl-2-oxobutanoate dehydrogenase subunit VorB [candidate division WOR-3 bacterium RBG_13_43_14]|uniref:3-methyl-2-oxobutanoate dehydrogenase subunit VorB n=1 Tax=candidate division WOR-3 bacterium RBG_13_43_14 TaxID=1802590 RepID=A0A1F4UBW7_UNCW3|nr:MAG: 3-methyl-2-oxobutanoate dehydrogenase subunit VorB [candidate division WOR-3 bacterium RBG_13_43_14]